MNTTAAMTLRRLNDERPEWRPWLSVLDEVLHETLDTNWEDFVPRLSQRRAHVPFLAKTSIVLSPDRLRRWSLRLIRAAAAGGTHPMATLQSMTRAELPVVELFRAALCQDVRTLDEIARRYGADGAALRAVAALLPMPFLHACSRRLGSSAANWLDGYCPLCGAWPAFAEVRGIERARYLRCGRCGEEWLIHWLYCPFCALADHDQLVSLVPQTGAPARLIEACKRCGGYLKSFTLLQGTDAFGVMIDDLASVDLDIAAIEQGYRRQEGPGYALNLLVGEQQTFSLRFLSWGR